MTTYLVTGASGQLGRLAVQALLDRGVAPADVVATARDTDAIADLAALGVVDPRRRLHRPGVARGGVRRRRPRPARLLQRRGRARRPARQRHRGRRGGRRRAARLHQRHPRRHLPDDPRRGAPRRPRSCWPTSGLPTVLLRNSWYLENYTDQAATALEHGAVLGAAGDGRVSAATRADYAAAAAAALVADDQAGRVHELGGDTAFTLDGVRRRAGRRVRHPRRLPRPARRGATAPRWSAPALPEQYADILADSDLGHRPRRAARRHRRPVPADRPPDHHAGRGDPRRAGLSRSPARSPGRWVRRYRAAGAHAADRAA